MGTLTKLCVDAPLFTPEQEQRIRKLIADAIVGARIIHPMDVSPETQAAIRRAIQES